MNTDSTHSTANRKIPPRAIRARPTSATRATTALLALMVAVLAGACSTSAPLLIGDATSRGSEAAASTEQSSSTAPASTADHENDSPTGIAAVDTTSSTAVTSTTQSTATPQPTTSPQSQESTEPASSTANTQLTSTVETLSAGGASALYRTSRLQVLETRYTTTAPANRIATSGNAWLVTQLVIESPPTASWRIEPEHISLTAPDGQRFEADVFLDRVGETEWSRAVVIEGRDRRLVHLPFEVSTPIDSVEGWTLSLDDGTTPLVMPLTGAAFATQYPIALPDGEATRFSTGSFSGCSGADVDTLVRSATVSLEGHGLAFDHLVRAASGSRIIAIDLDLTPHFDEQSIWESNCDKTMLWPAFLLRVDGRPVESTRSPRLSVASQASATLHLNFHVDATATRLELVGGEEETVLATWDLELPLALGDHGAERIPYRAGNFADPMPSFSTGRAESLETVELSDGGAAGEILHIAVTVGSSRATTSKPASLIAGRPELDTDGRSHIVIEVDVENLIDESARLSASSLVLLDPDGRPYGRAELYDRAGNPEYNFTVGPGVFVTVHAAFETDALVANVDGWSLLVHIGNSRPLIVPLSGPSIPRGYPLALQPGASARITANEFSGCDEPLLDVAVNSIDVEIEGWGDWTSHLIRVSDEELVIAIDLLVENLNPSDALEPNCVHMGFYPEYRLISDGRPLQSFRRHSSAIEGLTTGSLDLVYRIPADTREIVLVGGSDGTEIGRWLLKDAGQVLEDLGATAEDDRTVITLSEQVLFAFGESTLQQGAYAPLNRVAGVLVEQAEGQVQVVGHTDSIGDDASNQALSEARAQAVAAALVDAGVDASLLDVSGRGETEPVAPNETPEGEDDPAGRQLNRRVEISYSSG